MAASVSYGYNLAANPSGIGTNADPPSPHAAEVPDKRRRSMTLGLYSENRLKTVPKVCQPYPEQRLAVFIQGKSPVR